MIVKVSLFAVAKERIGSETLEVEIGENKTVLDLKTKIVNDFPELADVLDKSAFAVNKKYASDSTSIAANDEVGLIPPVSGG